MSLDVNVNIDLLKPVTAAGFGHPLILAYGEETEIPYTECSGIEDVVTAGFAASTDVYKAASLMLAQNNPPNKIAVCGSTEATAVAAVTAVANYGWRQLMIANKAAEAGVSEYIEAEGNRTYFVTSPTPPTTEGKHDRTITFVYSSEDYGNNAIAAVVGATAGYNAGEITYKNIILKGLTPQNFTDDQLKSMHEKGAFTVMSKAGDLVTTDGISSSGEYIDIIDSRDWIVQQLEYQTQKVLNREKKVPYTNQGIGQLENVCVNVLRTAYNNGMIGQNPDGTAAYTVAYSLRSQCAENDIAARKYVGGRFSFILSGAIHNVAINGEISVM